MLELNDGVSHCCLVFIALDELLICILIAIFHLGSVTDSKFRQDAARASSSTTTAVLMRLALSTINGRHLAVKRCQLLRQGQRRCSELSAQHAVQICCRVHIFNCMLTHRRVGQFNIDALLASRRRVDHRQLPRASRTLKLIINYHIGTNRMSTVMSFTRIGSSIL